MSAAVSPRDLPFYPTYETEVRGHVTVWWFVKEFSQSRYNYMNIPKGSNACTIITVLLASRCHYDKIQISSLYDYELSPDVVLAFAECVLEGNEIHEKLRKNGSLEHVNLTIPEAITSVGHKIKRIVEWKSALYLEDMSQTLYKNIKEYISEWQNCDLAKIHPDLYIILIADHRSVLFVFEEETDSMSLMDSHQHVNFGALVAQVPRVRLKALCHWFCCMINDCFSSRPDCYELSFLYFQKGKRKKSS